MAKIPVLPVGEESGGMVCGMYEAAPSSEGQYSKDIELGFAPRFVILLRVDNRDNKAGRHTTGSGWDSGNLAFASQQMGFRVSSNSSEFVECTQTGFRVYSPSSGSGSFNNPGHNYFYFAFR